MNEDFLNNRLQRRREEDALRRLAITGAGIDLCSNDYLGVVRNKRIESVIDHAAGQEKLYGSTGSRLISGNYRLIEETEKQIAQFHASPSALIFNSGYDANTGLLGSVPQRGDTILWRYDIVRPAESCVYPRRRQAKPGALLFFCAQRPGRPGKKTQRRFGKYICRNRIDLLHGWR